MCSAGYPIILADELDPFIISLSSILEAPFFGLSQGASTELKAKPELLRNWFCKNNPDQQVFGFKDQTHDCKVIKIGIIVERLGKWNYVLSSETVPHTDYSMYIMAKFSDILYLRN
jgi:hypothetical protein